MKVALAALLVTLVLWSPSHAASALAARPKLPECAVFAERVNRYVSMGENAAVKSLRAGDSDENDSIAIVCRILFQSKTRQPLRPMGLGALNVPYYSMPPAKWPLFPIVQTGSSYFVLGNDYMMAGMPESGAEYLAYCQTYGTFRKTPVPVPTRAQALSDLQHLRQSSIWRAIRWVDHGPEHKGPGYSDRYEWSYGYSEQVEWDYLKAQAE